MAIQRVPKTSPTRATVWSGFCTSPVSSPYRNLDDSRLFATSLVAVSQPLHLTLHPALTTPRPTQHPFMPSPCPSPPLTLVPTQSRERAPFWRQSICTLSKKKKRSWFLSRVHKPLQHPDCTTPASLDSRAQSESGYLIELTALPSIAPHMYVPRLALVICLRKSLPLTGPNRSCALSA